MKSLFLSPFFTIINTFKGVFYAIKSIHAEFFFLSNPRISELGYQVMADPEKMKKINKAIEESKSGRIIVDLRSLDEIRDERINNILN